MSKANQLTSPNLIWSINRSLSNVLALSDCSVASRFHASQACLAWFQDSSNEDNLLLRAMTSSDNLCVSEPLVKPSGDVICCLGDWTFIPSKNEEEDCCAPGAFAVGLLT